MSEHTTPASGGDAPTSAEDAHYFATESATPATTRGVHERLAALANDDADGATGQALSRAGTLPLRIELVRQLRRKRTQLIALVIFVLPIIIALAFKLGGADDAQSRGTPALVGLATVGATNFTLFAEFASVGFLLVVVVALFCGDTVASEASWSSLRYLLLVPIRRSRLLRQKLIVALTLSLTTYLLLPLWSFIVGGLFFGWAPGRSPVGGTFDTSEALTRLLIVVGYAMIQSLAVAALAFLLGVLTDAPLGAVGGAVLLFVVSSILDEITALDPYRRWLPTHFQYAWLDALNSTVVWDTMIQGVGVALTYAAVFFAIAWIKFERKDITS